MSDQQNIERGRTPFKLWTPEGDVRDSPPWDSIVVMEAVGDGGPDTAVEERRPQRLTRKTLDQFLESCIVTFDVEVPDHVGRDPEQRLAARIRIRCLGDFDPDQFLRQIPSAARLLELKAALDDLRSRRLGNAAVRRELQSLVTDRVRALPAAAAAAAAAAASPGSGDAAPTDHQDQPIAGDAGIAQNGADR